MRRSPRSPHPVAQAGSIVLAAAILAAGPLADGPEADASVVAARRTAARQDPTFRTAVRTVPVFVTVTDADGRLVRDLVRGDFTVLDEGRPQPIAVFARETQPISVVVLLDRSGSVFGHFRLVQLAAREFVTRLLPDDKARIGSFSHRVQLDPRGFTSDRDQLLTILHRDLQEPGPTPLWNAIAVGMTALSRQDGRRVVLVFSDGADRPGQKRASNMRQGDILRRAREEDVMVYAIGLAGASPDWTQPRANRPDPGLTRIAAESGGGYFELTRTADLAETFARVADELHCQYALGFTPEKLDGRTHSLEVRVHRPGVTVRARRSYVASPGR